MVATYSLFGERRDGEETRKLSDPEGCGRDVFLKVDILQARSVMKTRLRAEENSRS